jgi:hypothetical protein
VNADGEPKVVLHICTQWKPGWLIVQKILNHATGESVMQEAT